MIYEDVQRDTGALEAGNGWSSSEFESYDEHSDNEAKLPTKSKVEPVWISTQVVISLDCKWHHDWPGCFGWFPADRKKKINVTISSGASAVQLSLLMYRTVRKL